MTQLGRIEYALQGGRANTDFIDNSAGVDCSDYEVNIKILLNGLVGEGKMTMKARNQLLPQMEADVSRLVLLHNYRQNIDIDLMQAILPHATHSYQQFIALAEREGGLRTDLEYLPSVAELNARLSATGQSFTAPELAVLLAYAKIMLQRALLAEGGDVLDEYDAYVQSYFPQILVKQYKDKVFNHPLKREIIATQLSSQFISEMGITFMQSIQASSDVKLMDIVRMYVQARQLLGLGACMEALELDEHKTKHQAMINTRLELRFAMHRTVRWLLRHHVKDANEAIQAMYGQCANITIEQLSGFGKEVSQSYQKAYKAMSGEASVKKEHLERFALTPLLPLRLICLKVSKEQAVNIDVVERVYAVCLRAAFILVAAKHSTLQQKDSLDALASSLLMRAELDATIEQLLVHFLQQPNVERTESIWAWIKTQSPALSVWRDQVQRLSKQKSVSFDTFYVLIKRLSLII